MKRIVLMIVLVLVTQGRLTAEEPNLVISFYDVQGLNNYCSTGGVFLSSCGIGGTYILNYIPPIGDSREYWFFEESYSQHNYYRVYDSGTLFIKCGLRILAVRDDLGYDIWVTNTLDINEGTVVNYFSAHYDPYNQGCYPNEIQCNDSLLCYRWNTFAIAGRFGWAMIEGTDERNMPAHYLSDFANSYGMDDWKWDYNQNGVVDLDDFAVFCREIYLK